MSTATESSVVESVTLNEPSNEQQQQDATNQITDQSTGEPDAKKAKVEESPASSNEQPARKKRGRSSQTSFERAKAEAEALTKDLPKEEGEGRRTRSKTRPPVTTPAKEEPEKPTRARRTPSKAEKTEVTPKQPTPAKAAGQKGRRGRPPKSRPKTPPIADAPDALASDADDVQAESEPATETESNVEAKSGNEIAEVKENGQVAAEESKMETDSPAPALDAAEEAKVESQSSEDKAESAPGPETVAAPTTETSAISTKNNEPSTDAISSVETPNVEAKSEVSTTETSKAGDITEKVDESKSSTVGATVVE